jgi:hypothetical protein
LKILFFVHSLAQTRHFEPVILGLARRRHTIVLATARKRKPQKLGKAFQENTRIELLSCPTRRIDRWAPVVDPLRRTRDYLRFLDPRYVHATKLAARAAEHAPDGWSAALDDHPWLKRHWKLAQHALALTEAVTPPDPYFKLFVKAEAPDLVMVTPLIDFGSYQTDYVKCAHRLGIPVVFLPFSWDNLTNRGLIRVTPDRVLVWNEHQRREAVELHNVPADRVIVTGAPRFDAFFTMTPATSRQDFCAGLGLDPGRPLVLYVCSSGFVAPQEVGFVRRWIGELRRSAEGNWLRDSNVIVRPHPAYQDEWGSADLSDLAGVAVWRQRSTMNADQGLFDSLYHSAAVVGLNTSAMIEAAIVGRPVYTIALPEFAEGQGGTIHFEYLLAEHGGIVSMSENFAQHLRQLGKAQSKPERIERRSRRFVRSFVRPRGLKTPASRIMIQEIEQTAAIRKRPHRAPPWHYPLRWGLDAALRVGFRPSINEL